MQSLRKNLPVAMKQLCCHHPQSSVFLAVVGCSDAMHSKRSIDTLYGAETCEDCVESYRMPFAKKGLKKMKKPDPFKNKDPCWQSLRRTEYKCRTDPEFMLDAFIDAKKKCLGDPCAWDVPRADLTHYRPSDKLRRKYPRTWIKCVLKRRKIKMQCSWKPVRHERRKFKKMSKKSQCDQAPCALGAIDLKLSSCARKPKKSKCPKITMPFCKPCRNPPRCIKGGRRPSYCRKRLTKYPAFSECLMDPLPTAPPVECNCLKTPMMCQVWEYFRNRKS